ncbi:hypothetical protein EVJ58_g8822 [Rhodofomes roseus]|uniref:Uncharacterized protein n=1 Tax=Rhodofomes roseus TaxID=34475 RepID=A0A4Y9XZD2_9APHY|nr:hypothetical protein EVJ58_g8822 [Rhodofomes roseus]
MSVGIGVRWPSTPPSFGERCGLTPGDYDVIDESDDDRDELPSFIEEYLRRSKSYPLDVTIMGLNGTRVDDCIEVLQSHQHRVRKLRIQAEDHETMRSVLPRLSYMDAPLLEDLRLGAALPSYSIVHPPLIFQPHDLFGGHFPPLHSIYLSYVSLSLSAESNILRNLQHLILTGQGISITEMDTLFDILDRCPDLKTLKLHSSGLSPSTAPQHPSRTDRVVSLPSLRVASIDWEQSMVAGWLLTHLCLPETANLNVVLSRDDHLPVRASIRTLSSIRTLRIAIEEELLIQGYAHHNKPSFIRKSLRPTKSALSLCMRFHTEEEARDHFTHFLQAHRDVSLFSAVDTLTIGRGDFYLPDHWASLFEVMPGLRMLHVCGVDKSLSSCLAALCASDTARGQSATYVRPRLAALQILEIQGMRGLQNEDSKAALTRAVRLMSMEGALQTLRLNGRSPWHAGVDAELLRQFCTVEITEVASD